MSRLLKEQDGRGRNTLYLIKEELLQLLYPRVCPVCGEILAQKERPPYLCAHCFSKLRFPSEPRCLLCSRPLEDETEAYCRDCRREYRHFDRGVALLMHNDAAKKILYDLKYANRRDNADALAWMATRKYREVIRFWAPDVILPVPLYRKKELQRGFNQAALLAEKLAFYLARPEADPEGKLDARIRRPLQIPVDSGYLMRSRHTNPQKEMGRDGRKINVQGAFCIRKPEFAGMYSRVLLVDDIYTSGATLSECARVLKAEGVRQVFFLTFSIG